MEPSDCGSRKVTSTSGSATSAAKTSGPTQGSTLFSEGDDGSDISQIPGATVGLVRAGNLLTEGEQTLDIARKPNKYYGYRVLTPSICDTNFERRPLLKEVL